MKIEMSDNMQTQAFSPAELADVFVEMGWWSIERANFAAVDRRKRRPLQLTNVQTSADEQHRYYHAELRYADTGEVMSPPFIFDLRWEAT